MSEQRARRGEVSVLGWIGTLILSAIPVVNIVLWIVWTITGKRTAKRNFSIAMLILTAVSALLIVLACAFFGEQIANFCKELNARALAELSRLPAA